MLWRLGLGGPAIIRLDLASVAHPQSNGQVERANGLILSGIKPRLVVQLERSAGCWLDELPAVLWSLRTTPNKSTGFTPFFLVYGAEAVIPTDIEFDSPRITMYTEEEAKEAREDGVDLLEEPAVSPQPVRHLPARAAPLLQPQGQAKIFPTGRPCAPADPANSRPAQALGPLGRSLRRQQGTRQRLLLLDRRTKTKSTQER